MRPTFPPPTGAAKLHKDANEAELKRLKGDLPVDQAIDSASEDTIAFTLYSDKERQARRVLEEKAKEKRAERVETMASLDQLELSKRAILPGEYEDAKRFLDLKLEAVEAELRNLAKRIGMRYAECQVTNKGFVKNGDFWIANTYSTAEVMPYLKSVFPEAVLVKSNQDPLAPTQKPVRRLDLDFSFTKNDRARLRQMWEAAYHRKYLPHLPDEFDLTPTPTAAADPPIPEWFQHFEHSGFMRFQTNSTVGHWNELCNRMHRLEQEAKAEEERGGSKKPRDKHWHEPSQDWPFEHWRKHGGWWKCRSDSSASWAELACGTCHRGGASYSQAPTSSKQQYDALMKKIDDCSAVVAAEDKKTVLGRLGEQAKSPSGPGDYYYLSAACAAAAAVGPYPSGSGLGAVYHDPKGKGKAVASPSTTAASSAVSKDAVKGKGTTGPFPSASTSSYDSQGKGKPTLPLPSPFASILGPSSSFPSTADPKGKGKEKKAADPDDPLQKLAERVAASGDLLGPARDPPRPDLNLQPDFRPSVLFGDRLRQWRDQMQAGREQEREQQQGQASSSASASGAGSGRQQMPLHENELIARFGDARHREMMSNPRGWRAMFGTVLPPPPPSSDDEDENPDDKKGGQK